MSAKDISKKIAIHACIYYTATTFLLIFLFWLISNDIGRAMHPVALICVLPFSVCFAAANVYFRHANEKTGMALRVAVHYALTMAGFWLFLFLPNKSSEQTGAGAFMLFMIVTLLYAIVMGFILYFKARIRRVKRDEAKYTSVYKKK